MTNIFPTNRARIYISRKKNSIIKAHSKIWVFQNCIRRLGQNRISMKRDWVFRFDTYNNSLTFLSAVFIILVKSADLWLSSEENKTKQI